MRFAVVDICGAGKPYAMPCAKHNQNHPDHTPFEFEFRNLFIFFPKPFDA